MGVVDILLHNLPIALANLVGAIFYFKPKHKNYVVNVFYYADIVLNCLAGGNHRVTVSARTGFYAARYVDDEGYKGKYWRTNQSAIDTAFFPMDGEGHCRQAKEWTVKMLAELEGDNDPDIYQGPLFFLLLLLVGVMVSCIFLIPLLRIGKWLKMY